MHAEAARRCTTRTRAISQTLTLSLYLCLARQAAALDSENIEHAAILVVLAD
jgi:hypothetical protein